MNWLNTLHNIRFLGVGQGRGFIGLIIEGFLGTSLNCFSLLLLQNLGFLLGLAN